MKNLILLALSLFSVSVSAQQEVQTADDHLQAIITLNDCCVEVGYDDDGILYTFQGNGMVTAVIEMMNKYYPEVHGISGSPGKGVPYGFTDTEGKRGVFIIFEEANQDELVIAYNE